LDAGGRIIQETRHFHEDTGTTTSGRSKEEAQDYRYFPEPDLVPVAPPAEWVEQIRNSIVSPSSLPKAQWTFETPSVRLKRLQEEWRLPPAEMNAIRNADALDVVAGTVATGTSPAAAYKWWLGEILRQANDRGTDLTSLSKIITPTQVGRIEELVSSGKLNDRLARDVIDAVLDGEGDPDEVVKARSLAVVSDEGTLTAAVDEAIAANPDVVAKIRGGKIAAVGVLVGAVRTATGGKADAARVRELILERLS